METHSTAATEASNVCCRVGNTRPAMLASSCPRNAPMHTVPTTSQRYAGQVARRASGGRSARSGLSAAAGPLNNLIDQAVGQRFGRGEPPTGGEVGSQLLR